MRALDSPRLDLQVADAERLAEAGAQLGRQVFVGVGAWHEQGGTLGLLAGRDVALEVGQELKRVLSLLDPLLHLPLQVLVAPQVEAGDDGRQDSVGDQRHDEHGDVPAAAGLWAKLESGELPLEESLRLFEEGISLSKRAGALLDQAERKVEALTRAADGTLDKVPFEAESRDGEE